LKQPQANRSIHANPKPCWAGEHHFCTVLVALFYTPILVVLLGSLGLAALTVISIRAVAALVLFIGLTVYAVLAQEETRTPAAIRPSN